MSFSVVCTGLGFNWPDGSVVFEGFDFNVGPGRSGLIGVNGSGKSTLLKLIAGELTPYQGSVSVAGTIGYLPQSLTLDAERRVDEVLGIAETRRAVLAIEHGEATEANFALVGDDWDVEKRALAVLDRVGLARIGLDRTVGELSGGEAVLLGLAGLLFSEPDVLLLDEPTNNLDIDARRRLYEVVATWRKVLLVISHDRELLELVDQVADLSYGEVRWYGGNLTAYEEAVAIEREAAERAVRTAEADVRRQRRDLADARVKLDRRQRYGRKMESIKREPKIIMSARKREAQVSAGKHRNLHLDRLADARARLTEAEEAVRNDDEIRIDLPETAVPAGRTLLVCEDVTLRHATAETSLIIRGPERIALLGPNGAGKTTLLRTIAGALPPESGSVQLHAAVGYLPQRLDLLDDRLSVADNLKTRAPAAGNTAIRSRLARFLFRGDRADQPVGTLSGGERFRAALAVLLAAEPPPQLLMLDEPTNNLDMASVRRLVEALDGYQGALIVAAHDLPFLRSIGITRWLRLDPATGLHDLDPDADLSAPPPGRGTGPNETGG